MFIENGGGENYLPPDGKAHTIAMTDPTGTVTVEQQGVDDSTWFEYQYEGASAGLDSATTARAIYSHLRLKVTASGTGVRLYSRKQGNQKHNIILK